MSNLIRPEYLALQMAVLDIVRPRLERRRQDSLETDMPVYTCLMYLEAAKMTRHPKVTCSQSGDYTELVVEYLKHYRSLEEFSPVDNAYFDGLALASLTYRAMRSEGPSTLPGSAIPLDSTKTEALSTPQLITALRWTQEWLGQDEAIKLVQPHAKLLAYGMERKIPGLLDRVKECRMIATLLTLVYE